MFKRLTAALVLVLFSIVVGSTAAGQVAAKGGDEKVSTAPPAARSASVTEDELLALLPASDIVATIDVARLYNDLLPRLTAMSFAGVDKVAKDVQDFVTRTGIDLSKADKAVLGLSMNGTQGAGAILINGLELDDLKLEGAMKAYNAEFKVTEYEGRKIFNLISKIKPPEAGPISVKTDQLAIATLDARRVVLGDFTAVKKVIDIHTGGAKGGVSPEMISGLKETDSSGLIRFSLTLPEGLRQEAASQGDLFKSIAGIKLILGTLNVAPDFALSLDSIMRTASQNDAAELESGLKGLIGLLKGFLGGDPKLDLFNQLLDQVRIGSKLSDVSLSITLPREMMDQLSKKPEPVEKKQ